MESLVPPSPFPVRMGCLALRGPALRRTGGCLRRAGRGGAPSARRARAEGAGGARGARLRAGPASVGQRFRKLDAKMQGPQIALVVCRRETFRQHHLDRADAYRSGQRHERSEHGHVVRNRRTEAFPDRAPERQTLGLRLHLAARMHELGIIDAQPAGADQRQVLDAGRIGERYEDVRLLHLGVIDSLVRQDHVRTRGPAARFRPVGL
mgnify:CR=1 FL=1